MGVAKFCVVFDKSDPIYYPGETMTGRVELVLNSTMKIEGIKLKLKGRAKCEWSESHSKSRVFRSSETYLKNEQTFVEEREAKMLQAKKYVYPFAVMIPSKAPSSFKSHYGEISYYGKAKIIIPHGFDYKKRTRFTIISPLDLNLYPQLRTTYKEEKSKMFCCLWCASGPLTMVVNLPKTGFATSECIPIIVEIDNASNIAVNAIYISLKRKIKWIAEGHHKTTEVELQKLRSGGVREGQSQTWSEYFTIPPTIFPNLEDCSIIRMSHVLHIEARAAGMHLNLNARIPIMIGDIQLSEDTNAPIFSLQVPNNPNNMAPVPASSSQGYPQSEYHFTEITSSKSVVQSHQSQPQPQIPPSALSSQFECSHSALHSPVTCDNIIVDGSIISSSRNTAQLE
ncbi:arrestin domain-containing protein 3-like [Planococcus citri]|uniref:arrestin domain-containing protein 3-like n=1 Tax=Planococcus citri TaxID=170843 RepID=UPI0031F90C8F